MDVVRSSEHEGARMTLVSPVIGLTSKHSNDNGADPLVAVESAVPEESLESPLPPGKRGRKTQKGSN